MDRKGARVEGAAVRLGAVSLLLENLQVRVFEQQSHASCEGASYDHRVSSKRETVRSVGGSRQSHV